MFVRKSFQFRLCRTKKQARLLQEAGRKLGWVNPSYTTQDCSQCGYRQAKALSERCHAVLNMGSRQQGIATRHKIY